MEKNKNDKSPMELGGDENVGSINFKNFEDIDSNPIENEFENPINKEEGTEPIIVLSGEEDVEDKTPIISEGEKPKSEPSTINILARAYQERGLIPEDIEIPDDINEETFFEMYTAANEQVLRNEIEQKIIKEKGWTPEIIETAYELNGGLSTKEIQLQRAYTQLAGVVFDEDADEYLDAAKEYLNNYYIDIKFDQSRLSKQLDRDLESEDLPEILESAKKHFAEKKAYVIQENARKKAEKEQADAKKAQDKIDTINSYINSGKLKGVEYSKEDMAKVKKALTEPTEIYNGKRVTLYQKKKLELLNDPEAEFKDIVDFILNKPIKIKEAELQEKGKKSILADLNKVASAVPKASGEGDLSENISKYGEKVFSV